MTDSSSPVAADLHGTIKVRGARVNNLKNLDVDVPKRRLTVFTGVSGSGEILPGFRHDRRGITPAYRRNLLSLRPRFHAFVTEAGCGCVGKPLTCDHY